MEIFGELERVAADLYPYRWPITAGLVVAMVAAVWVAWRLDWHIAVWRHRLLATALAVPLMAAAVPTGYYTLSPLWQRSHLEEQSPLASAGAARDPSNGSPAAAAQSPENGSTPGAESSSFAPRLTHTGMFMGADSFHFGRGDAQIIETAPGRFTLRFENFSVRNGPDLFVYLLRTGNDIDGDAINLGELKATDGAFNYEIPEGTDVSQFTSAIVWCRQFAVLFAAAPLDAV